MLTFHISDHPHTIVVEAPMSTNDPSTQLSLLDYLTAYLPADINKTPTPPNDQSAEKY